jgi:structural maintenance of chromosome 3 (chondroitin sulfate proteoglycan 6)
MFIKYVLIKKYKSYRELSYMEPLSEGVNVVIGANGHGKSNFLDAIIFVLTDKYSNLRQEEKKLLVHEDPGEEITQISVELIIDNKSRRFPVDKDSINITKIYHINENREEILINQKKLMRSDVFNLLESAGFCKQNPYYIIQQGKINTIINMNEFELFEQFAEITGTKIYEEKKLESIKLLEEAKENKQKIIKQKEEINDYILRLENQCEDLSSFEVLEAKKKACEFFISNEKVSDFQINIDLLEERKLNQAQNLQALTTSINSIREKINEKLILQTRINKHLEVLKQKIRRCDTEISEIHKFTYKEEASLKMLKENQKHYNEQKKELESQLNAIKVEQTNNQQDYLRVTQKVRDLDKEIENMQIRYNELKYRNDNILIKKSSETGFKSEEDKKKFINDETKKLNKMKDDISSKIFDLNNFIKNDEERLKNLTKESESIEIETNDFSLSLKLVNDNLIELKKKRVEMVNNIKKIDLQINDVDEESDILKDSQKILEKTIPNYEVVQAVIKIKEENFSGCLGTILDIITCDRKYKNAMDLFAKDKLFSLVVENYEVANQILEFNKTKNGPVINILPLDWNKDRAQINYPTTSDAVPFVQFIEIREEFLHRQSEILPIIYKLFGKCLLVKNYEVGLKLAKTYNMSCITAENEVIYAGGYVTKVGYYDFKKQRCSLYEQIIENYSKIQSLKSAKINQENDRHEITNDELKIQRETQSYNINKNDLLHKLQELSKKREMCLQEIISTKQIIDSKKNIIEKLIQDKATVEQRIRNYNAILSNSDSNLTINEEKEELDQISSEKEVIERKLIELEKAKNFILKQKLNLESKLNDYLSKKEIELTTKLSALNQGNIGATISHNFDLTEQKVVLNEIEHNLNDLKKLEDLKERLRMESNHLEKELEVNTNEVSILKSELNKFNEKINKNETELKSVVLSLNDTIEKKNTLIKNIAALGMIKSEEVEKFVKLKEKQAKLIQNESGVDMRNPERKLNKILEPIYQKLEDINRKMKKYEKINRFAIDDYKLFKNKREEVNERMEDLQSKEDELFEVIKVLDDKKENAIQTTFEKVSASFESIFKDLVPNGFANLSLENINLNTGLTQNNTQLGNKKKTAKAIFINVSFSGNQNAIQSMNQLSGGQKTAVAVALIFALSKIDPPPFYILDEIDAALDPNMRTNLAKLIQIMSESNQYIISTFKPEILDVSQNIYHVKFSNKTSNLNKINLDEANNFIKDINI